MMTIHPPSVRPSVRSGFIGQYGPSEPPTFTVALTVSGLSYWVHHSVGWFRTAAPRTAPPDSTFLMVLIRFKSHDLKWVSGGRREDAGAPPSISPPSEVELLVMKSWRDAGPNPGDARSRALQGRRSRLPLSLQSG